MPRVTLTKATRYGGKPRAAGDVLEVGDVVAERWTKARHPLATLEAEAVDLGKLSKDELVAEAEKRGVDSSGTKADILARLE